MIGRPAGTRIWIVAGVTDMRRGFIGLAAMVQTALQENPFSGHVFIFRGRRGDLIKVLWWSGDGLCLFAKRLERGRFIWPQAASGTVSLTPAQLSMLLEGIIIAWPCSSANEVKPWLNCSPASTRPSTRHSLKIFIPTRLMPPASSPSRKYRVLIP
jgi:transposase